MHVTEKEPSSDFEEEEEEESLSSINRTQAQLPERKCPVDKKGICFMYAFSFVCKKAKKRFFLLT